MFKKAKQYLVDHWPTIRSILYRFFRGAFATAAAETLYIACGQAIAGFDAVACFISLRAKWTDPKEAMTLLAVAFTSGFIVALGKAIREKYGLDEQGNTNTLSRVLPV
jgi:hypothetical protein